MKKIIVLSCVALFAFLFYYAETAQSDIADNVLRLHVLANSDSEEDQAVKLAVRDRLLEESRDLFADCDDPGETEAVVAENQEHLTRIASETVREMGYTYPVTIETTDCYFPARTYGNIALPAGEYEAVRVCLGAAEGKNWWCVMFPPLCFVDSAVGEVNEADIEKLHDRLDYDIITKDGDLDVQVKFKVVDLFQSTAHAVRSAFRL